MSQKSAQNDKDLDSLEHSRNLFSRVFVFRIRQSKDGAIGSALPGASFLELYFI